MSGNRHAAIEDYTWAFELGDSECQARSLIGRAKQQVGAAVLKDYVDVLSIGGAPNSMQLEALGEISRILNSEMTFSVEYKKISFCQERLLRYILNEIDPESKKDMLEKALNKMHPLGQLFWTKRGFFAPKISAGTLNTICDALAKERGVEKSVVARSYTENGL